MGNDPGCLFKNEIGFGCRRGNGRCRWRIDYPAKQKALYSSEGQPGGMEVYFGAFRLGNWLFQRGLAAIYLIAFLVALNQFPALLGEQGLLPVQVFMKRVPFVESPSLFYFAYSDRLFALAAWSGIFLAVIVLSGVLGNVAWWFSSATWLALFALYLSIVNVGQTFYAFGWELMLVEAGFFAAFLGPAAAKPSLIPVLALRWMLFRLMLGGGLIKLRNDPCWHNLTCLEFHFETQPLPNPLSWYFHQLPVPWLKAGVLFNNVVEVVAPFGLLGPQPVAAVAGLLVIAHQLMLISSGNFAFLNWLTIVLSLTAFSDRWLKWIVPVKLPATPSSSIPHPVLYLLAAATILLSIQPALNLISRNQIMNDSYNSLRLVNSYGMFGTITKERYEIVIEGTADAHVTPDTRWIAYEFKAKPGDMRRRPPQIAPYHLHLDWQMWFQPFSVAITGDGLIVPGYAPWFPRFVNKLLEGDVPTRRLLAPGPFTSAPPAYIRARFYRYRFTTAEERRRTGDWWHRELIGEYLPPMARGAYQEP